MGIACDPKFSDMILGKMYDIYYDATVRMLEEVGDILDVWVYWDDLERAGRPDDQPGLVRKAPEAPAPQTVR